MQKNRKTTQKVAAMKEWLRGYEVGEWVENYGIFAHNTRDFHRKLHIIC